MIVNVINTWVLELLWVMWVHSIRVCTTRPARNRCFNYTVIEEPFRSSIIDRLTNKWDLLHQEVPMHARSFVENPFCFDWYIFLSWWMCTYVFGRIFGRIYVGRPNVRIWCLSEAGHLNCNHKIDHNNLKWTLPFLHLSFWGGTRSKRQTDNQLCQ